MFLLWMILIKPAPGEFRTKIENLPNAITAYSLLVRKKNNEQQENFIVNEHKINFITPPEKKYTFNKKHQFTSIFKAIKNKQPIFFNNGKLES